MYPTGLDHIIHSLSRSLYRKRIKMHSIDMPTKLNHSSLLLERIGSTAAAATCLGVYRAASAM